MRIVSILPSTTEIVCALGLEDAPQREFTRRLGRLGVRSGEVWATDASSYFSRPGPRVVDGVEILARILHPEVFGAPNNEQAVRV